MRVLVTGGTGYIGSNLCEELVDRGNDVTALARNPEAGDVPDGVSTYAGDITEYGSVVDAFEGMDAVVNLVSPSPLYRPRGGNQMYDRVHRAGTEITINAAEEHDVERIVQMSSILADPGRPTAYLKAKGVAEEAFRTAMIDWVILRPTVAFGEGGEFVSFMKMVAPPYITPLPGGGHTRFQLMWIEDLVSIMADAVEKDEHLGRIYELGGPERLTMAQIARMIHRADGRPSKVVPVPMSVVKWGARLGQYIPRFPFGPDQYRSLQMDLVTEDNDVDAFGFEEDEMTTFAEWLGLDASRDG